MEAVKKNAGPLAACAALALVVLAPALPLRGRLPGMDSGIYLYNAWRMLHGAVPYRDMWDSKPPLISPLNAVGLALGGGSEWGVWALQLAFLWAALGAGFSALRRELGAFAAAVGTLLFAAGVARYLEGGNFPEEYGLLLQAAVIWLAVRRVGGPKTAAVVGVLAGALFGLKQSLFGTPLAWLLCRLYELRGRPREAGREAGAFAAGGLAAAGLPLLVCSILASWHAVWSQAFGFNLAQAGWTTPAMRLESIVSGAVRGAGFAVVAGFGWAALASSERPLSPLERLALVGLPLDLALSTANGWDYGHYRLVAVPLAAVAAAALAARLGTSAERRRVVAAFAVVAALSCGGIWQQELGELADRAAKPDPAVEFLREHAGPDDPVLVWGHVCMRYYFAARRRCAARVGYFASFAHRGFDARPLARQVLEDLAAHPPAAVLDVSGVETDVPPVDPAKRANWVAGKPEVYGKTEAAEATLRWLDERYAPAAEWGGIVGYLPKHG